MLCAELLVGLRRIGVGGRVFVLAEPVDAVLEQLRMAIRSKHQAGLPAVAAVLREVLESAEWQQEGPVGSDEPLRLPHLLRLAAAICEQASDLHR